MKANLYGETFLISTNLIIPCPVNKVCSVFSNKVWPSVSREELSVGDPDQQIKDECLSSSTQGFIIIREHYPMCSVTPTKSSLHICMCMHMNMYVCMYAYEYTLNLYMFIYIHMYEAYKVVCSHVEFSNILSVCYFSSTLPPHTTLQSLSPLKPLSPLCTIHSFRHLL